MRSLLVTLHSKFIHPSLALPYLATYCADLPLDLRIREFTIHEPRENILAALLSESPEALGFSIYLWNRAATLELIDALIRVNPGLKIFVGGPEVSFEEPRFLETHNGISALVRGEGELPVYGLLRAWSRGEDPHGVPRLLFRDRNGAVHEGSTAPPITDLDQIPSPFAQGQVDLTRGFVYLETSRGCPYDCAFCMSALDSRVRSFSMERIRSDLALLMERKVPKIKLVDRTFNYNADRAREIFRFILDHNRSSHFHFEIGAHLLDEATLQLLEEVPAGWFQFEIGVQSTLPETLRTIRRKAAFEQLADNVRRLRQMGTIELHLDLIAGLPGEGLPVFLESIDRVMALRPDHLQIEPVKLLPGAPLRQEAEERGIVFDPAPPYQVLRTADLGFAEIEHLRGISRLLDLSWNHHRLQGFLLALAAVEGSFAQGLAQMAHWFQSRHLLRHPLSQQGLFDAIHRYLQERFTAAERKHLVDRLAYDFALSERVSPQKAPDFFNGELTPKERQRVATAVAHCLEEIRGRGIKLHYFAVPFTYLESTKKRQVILFLYRIAPGQRMAVEALPLPA